MRRLDSRRGGLSLAHARVWPDSSGGSRPRRRAGTHRSSAVSLLPFLIVLLLLGAALPARAALSTEGPAAGPPPACGGCTAYTLPQAQLARSRSLYYWRTALDFGGSLWAILICLAILQLHWASGLRRWVTGWTNRRWLQGLCFLPLLLLLASLLNLPIGLLAHHVALAYGQSIEGWGGWFADWSKSLLLTLVSGTVVLLVVFALIRHTRRWWLWLWLLSLPTQLVVVFILPLAVDPLFNHFEPLDVHYPALVAQLERVVAKTGTRIPPSRMYLMRASDKVTGSNAYVTGFGASKRVVVWDTTIKSCPTDEILVIFGHELGHYVLGHIQRGLVIASALSFFFLWIGFHFACRLAARWGPLWRITALEDWAAAAILLLALSALTFAVEPIQNFVSRAQEHQADVFGQEAVHGIVANPRQAAASGFQRLGEESLEYPSPNPFVVSWTYSHPPVAKREAFAARYNPWQPGAEPRYFTRGGVLRPHRLWGGL